MKSNPNYKIVEKRTKHGVRKIRVRQLVGGPDQDFQLPTLPRSLHILVPPGIGDIHWVLLRLKGLLRASNNLQHKPVIHVCSGDPAYDRSRAFIEMVPWVHWGGYFDIRPKDVAKWANAAFFHGKIFINQMGFDAFLSANKLVELGTPMDEIWPQAGETDWNYQLNVPEPWEPEDPLCKHRRGIPYILATFYKASFYGSWWDKQHPAEILKAVGDLLNHDILLVGAAWDQKVAAELEKSHRRVVNLAGKTSFWELMQLKGSASGFIGHPSGSGMIAQFIGIPTVLQWGPWWQFSPGMRRNWVKPHAGRYSAVEVGDKPETIAKALEEVIGGK